MSVRLPKPPKQGAALVADRLQALRGDDAAPLGVERPAAYRPAPLYTIDFDALVAGAGLDAAQRVGWRFVVQDAAGLATADLMEPASGEPYVFAIDRSGAAERLLEVMREAEARATGSAFEGRLLEFGRLGLAAFWLHRPGEDLVVERAGAGARPAAAFIAEAVLAARAKAAAADATGPLAAGGPDDDRGG